MSGLSDSGINPIPLPTSGGESEGTEVRTHDPQRSEHARKQPGDEPRRKDGSSTSVHHIVIEGASVAPNDPTVISDNLPVVERTSTGGATPAELGQILEGERLDHFELDRFIGGGGMGAVFRGTDTALGRTVAIKVLLRQYAADEETTRRFNNEAQSAARLDHENIARVYYVGEDRGWHYIVFEYVEGDNLRDLVNRSGPLPLADFVLFALQAAEALDHASNRDVVHRDIKPSNVLVTADGRAKLVDMGLARLHQVEHSHDDLTASGVTLGTFDYISPEQARDPRSADVRSDLYSLGCTLYFMLAGQPPFPEGTVLQKLLQHQGDQAPDLRSFRPDMPDSVCRLIKKLLAKNPKDRYQEPRNLVVDLVAISDELCLHRPSLSNARYVAEPPISWWRTHLPWIVPVLVLVGITFFVHHTSRGPTAPLPTIPKAYAVKPIADSMVPLETPQKDPLTEPQASSDGGRPQPNGSTFAAAEENGTTGGSAASPDAAPNAAGPSAADPPNGTAVEGVADTPPGSPAAEPVERAKPENGGNGNSDPMAIGEPPSESEAAGNGAAAAAGKEFIVDGKGGSARTFATLNAALNAARNSESNGLTTIELRYSGRLPASESPFAIRDELTIRAPKEYQPVIYFRPEAEDPALVRHSMVDLAGGSLTVSNVHFELDLTGRINANDWSLFEGTLAKKVRLINCWLTIRNTTDGFSAQYKDVSFFKILSPLIQDVGAADNSMSAIPTQISLRNCVARGEAAFLHGTALETVELKWDNGLLAISERFVEISSQTRAIPLVNQLHIDLERVTVAARNGFCSMELLQDKTHLANVRVDSRECIFVTAKAPLIEQRGPDSTKGFMDRVRWYATQNFYENFDVFWKIDSFPDAASEMEWTAWQTHWQNNERPDRPMPVQWNALPPPGIAVSEHTPRDYHLMQDDSNPALGAAPDMSDVGLQFGMLPGPPITTILPTDPDTTADERTVEIPPEGAAP